MTEAQARVYRALVGIAADGWPVTIRELAAETALTLSTVHHHLERLGDQGHVANHPRNPRGGVLPVLPAPNGLP